jgi:hypothetical protein
MVISVKEHWERRGGTFGSIRDSSVRRHWKVKTDSAYDDQGTIRDHFRDNLGITLFVPHPNPNLPQFTFRNLDCDQFPESPKLWDVTGTYSSDPTSEEDQQNENPLLRPTIIEWDSKLSQEFTARDKDGKAMLNSAGDGMESIEKDSVRWIITLQRNFDSLPSWVAGYVNKVNSSGIVIDGQSLAARTCKLQRLRVPARRVENGVSFVEVIAEIAYRSETWDVYRLDEGFNTLDRVGEEKLKILIPDEDGEMREPTEPVPLDGSGQALLAADEDTAVFRHFKIYEEADFSVLPF